MEQILGKGLLIHEQPRMSIHEQSPLSWIRLRARAQLYKLKIMKQKSIEFLRWSSWNSVKGIFFEYF